MESPFAVKQSALSLNVDDVPASSAFAQRHFGFAEAMAADGFASLHRPDAGFNLIFLRNGLPSFQPERMKGHRADGLLVAFVVDDIDDQYERLQREGVAILTPIETEAWGERYFQVADPNGVVFQLVQWVTPPPQEALPGGAAAEPS
jgi:predicted enzyme related to lactoylglutathione lyase